MKHPSLIRAVVPSLEGQSPKTRSRFLFVAICASAAWLACNQIPSTRAQTLSARPTIGETADAPVPLDHNSSQVGTYVEFASGLNYKDDSGQWQRSQDLIELDQNGQGVAVRGPHKVTFSPNLNTQGAITITSVSNRVFRTHIIGLFYFDSASGQSAQVASLQDSLGEIYPPNQVIYKSAFKGVKADVRLTYTKAAFETDVILLEQPPAPEAFGFSSATTRLEVWHEFLDPPTPQIQPKMLRKETNPALRAAMAEPDFTDDTLDFGDLWLPLGKGFSWDGPASPNKSGPAEIRIADPFGDTNQVAVGKHWLQINGATVLVESVELPQIASKLDALPKTAKLEPGSQKMYAVHGRQLPEKRMAKKTSGVMKMASAPYRAKSYVLDYVAINPSGSYTFSSGVTYYITTSGSLGGATTFSPGCVIKFANNAYLLLYGTIACNGSSSSPSILTSKDDDAYGDIIADSTGNPTYMADRAIWLYYDTYSAPYTTLNYIQIRWAKTGIQYDDNVGNRYYLNNVNLRKCQTGIYANSCKITMTSVTKCSVSTPTTSNGATFTGTITDDCQGDADSDGLPDSWEIQYFGNITAQDQNGDPDGDGLTNMREYRLGTSPVQAAVESNPLALLPVGTAYMRVISPKVLELVRIAPNPDNTEWANYGANPPLPSAFNVTANGTTITVQQVGFKRRPLYNSYPDASDLRIEDTVYLTWPTGTPMQDNALVRVTAPGATFSGFQDPLRYGPAIHVNQDGYIASNSGILSSNSKKAKVGYFLGSLGELNLSLPPQFFIVDAATGAQVYQGSLASRSDTGWNTGQAQYQYVLEADFTGFTTAGTYRLKVAGLGASFPFTLNDSTPLKWARTYALGLYHQRCGAANATPYTRFTHGSCHTLAAFIPAAPSYPYLCSFQFHDGRLSCYNYPGCTDGAGCGAFVNTGACGARNPTQTAPLLCHFAASVNGSGGTLFPFVDSGTKNVSLGHHDAGDYSKYVINSAQFIHILVFAADNFTGAASLDNLGIPESSDNFSDLLQEAKWEADFLVNMRDRGIIPGQGVIDGGFYFLVYPVCTDACSEYESWTPDRAPRQLLYPKTMSVTASAVAALADIASSPTFKSHYPTEAGIYLQAARDGWNFLMRAITAYGTTTDSNGTWSRAYQKITIYGDNFLDADELLWAAAAMFAATGESQYQTKFLAWLPATFPQQDGYWRLFGGWGCAARDYAFAVRSTRLTTGLDANALSHCENEILDAGEDWYTRSHSTSYGTSLPDSTKAQFNPGWYFSTERAFEIAVGDALDQTLPSTHPRYDSTRHGRFVPAMIENFNYQHGCNPLNEPFVTGVGSKRQRVIVHQYHNWPNYDKRFLPPSGVPIGNLSDTYNNATLNNFAYPTLSSSGAGYALYDRWTDAYNLRTEFVILQTARSLAAATRLHNISGASYQTWQKADGYFSFPNGGPALNSPTVTRLECSDPTVNLDQAQITWDVELENQPALGRTFTVKPRTTFGETLIEAEAVLPDGRRVFGRQYLELNDAVTGGVPFPWPDPQSHTVALYHFDDPQPGFNFKDDTGHGYGLSPQGFPTLNGNNSWMQSRSGLAAQFGGLGDRLTNSVNLIARNDIQPDVTGLTIEFRMYIKRLPNSGSAVYLFRLAQGPVGGNTSEWSIYYHTQDQPFPQFLGPGGQVVLDSNAWVAKMTPNTWHLVKITADTTRFTKVYIDDMITVAGSHLTSPYFDPTAGWTVSVGDFVGCIDDLRISDIVR